MKKLFLLAALAALPLIGSAQKKVTGSVEIMPNYLWHLFASSNLWDESDSRYGTLYGHTIPEADRKFLYDNRELIAWGYGQTGIYTGILFFHPLRSKMNIEQYVAFLEEIIPPDSDPMSATCKELTRIIRDNYAVFEQQVWPRIEPDLLKSKEMIEARFAGIDAIGLWEKNLGTPFPGEKKELVLTLANAMDKLPSANNLYMEWNNFGIIPDEKAVEKVYQVVLHEIGIFIIFPTLETLQLDATLQTEFLQEGNIVYVAIETFAEKRKDDIFGGTPEVFLRRWETEFRWFYDYYRQNDSPGADPKTLIWNAITAYVLTYNGK